MYWIETKEKDYPYGGIIVTVFSHYKQKSFTQYVTVTDEGIIDHCGEPIDETEYEITHWMHLPKPAERNEQCNTVRNL